MNTKSGYAGKLFSGIVLITVGILWLLSSLDIITLSWRAIWHLWPLIVVWVGISLLPIPEIYRLILNMLTLGVGVLMLLLPHADKCDNREWEITVTQSEEWQTDTIGGSNVCGLYDKASLALNVGAGTLTFDTTCLLATSAGNDALTVLIKSDTNARKAKVIAKTPPGKYNIDNTHFKLKLNPTLLWDMDLEIGACSGTIDLSPFKVQDLELNAGATNITVRLGDKVSQVKAEVSAGASDITLEVPKTMQCIIEKETALVSSDFKGFKKQNGQYIAEAEGVSKGTIFLEIEAGVAQIRVRRY
jgi:hypothetical protein